MRRFRGFTMVEILIVVFIIGIIAIIPSLAYMRHVKKAIASEAVAAMALIREALRDYHITHHVYLTVGSGDLDDLPPTGLGIDIGVAKYFSGHSYYVLGVPASSTVFTNPGPVDFVIYVSGDQSVQCGESDCAVHADRVADYRLALDNTGRIFISYDSGTNWEPY